MDMIKGVKGERTHIHYPGVVIVAHLVIYSIIVAHFDFKVSLWHIMIIYSIFVAHIDYLQYHCGTV